MRYLLDTCTVSDFVKGLPLVQARILATPPDLFAVTSITRMEIEYGLALNPERARKLAPVLDAFLSVITTLDFEREDAEATAAVRAALRVQSKPIGPYDVMIAGTALSRGLVVVTSNTSEFGRVSGLRLEDWRSGPG